MQYAIGIDLGGTNIKAVVVSESGQILEKATRETIDDSSGESAKRTRSLISELKRSLNIGSALVGLAAPGVAAPDGRAIVSINGKLQDIIGLDWTNYLSSDDKVPVINDAHAALLGEAWIGAALGRRNAVLVTLGTGVGGAIIAEGALLRGRRGLAGHLGYICLNVDGPKGTTPIPGSLEYAIGNSTLKERSNGLFDSTRALVAAHLGGDERATAIWLRSVYYLACGISSIVNALEPEVIIVGGGIARSGKALFEPLSRYLDEIEWRPDGERVPVVGAALGEYAGAVGAGFWTMKSNSSRSVEGGLLGETQSSDRGAKVM